MSMYKAVAVILYASHIFALMFDKNSKFFAVLQKLASNEAEVSLFY